MKIIASIILVLFLVVFSPANAEDDFTVEKQKILAVLKQFEEGIQEKNVDKLTGIFMYPDAPLLGVREGSFTGTFDPKRNTAAGLVRTVTGEIDMQERLSGYDFYINGGIASVHCKYEFFRDGKMTNHGTDIFSLVKTPGGWKIMSVIYTVTMTEN